MKTQQASMSLSSKSGVYNSKNDSKITENENKLDTCTIGCRTHQSACNDGAPLSGMMSLRGDAIAGGFSVVSFIRGEFSMAPVDVGSHMYFMRTFRAEAF